MKKIVTIAIAALMIAFALCACTPLIAPTVQTAPADTGAQAETAPAPVESQPVSEPALSAENTASDNTSSEQAQPAEPVQPAEPAKPAEPAQTDIGLEAAKKIALDNAGLSEAEVTLVVWGKTNLDRDDGRTVYDIEFYCGYDEYEYEIDPATGDILSFDRDIEGFDARDIDTIDDVKKTPTPDDGQPQSNVQDTGIISEADARAIALAKVPGAGSGDMYIHKDRDDGRTVYEGEIVYNGIEYEFEIDASSGRIIEWDAERYDGD